MTALEYLAGLPFPPDEFQRAAALAIDDGASVVVSAPTGSGKTVAAEAAMARALGRGERAVYTTPIKALSNQKYTDLRAVHGDDRVGLLTGDNTINPRADVLVMTTEVLRNMMYADGDALDGVGVAILDEVHYLQDRERGAVWEEIIVHLDRSVPLVCLSATVANQEEFAAWVEERRGPTRLVTANERPVPLESLYLVRDKWERGALHMLPVFHGGRPNERLARMLRSGGGKRYGTPRRHETADLLRRSRLLPAIYFVFSRAGCDASVATVVDRGLRLTSAAEREEIRAVAQRRVAHLAADDLTVLGYDRWLHRLEAGVAAHHAGMVPAMKETVEELFSAGLVRLVFATETLALGINMPARSVVIESLSKFTGEGHELLRPGDYTQLTGRAGRRGIDTEGTAVILHSPYVEFPRAAGIAGQGSHMLHSSFRPSYNMAVNLVAIYDRSTAESLLEASFARFRERHRQREADERVASDRERLAELRRIADLGGPGVWEAAAVSAPSRLTRMAEFASLLRAGDVLEGTGRGTGRHVVIARGTGSHPRLITIDEAASMHRIAPAKMSDAVAVAGRIPLPTPHRSARNARFRADVAAALADVEPPSAPLRPEKPAGAEFDADAVAAARTATALERHIAQRLAESKPSAGGLVPEFRALVSLLEERGHVDGWSLTPAGERLRRIYNPMDLVLCESLDAGLFEDLDGPATAALASAFTFEPRRESGETVWPEAIAAAAARVEDMWASLAAREGELGLDQTRPPEPGFAALALRWAAGESLGRLFDTDGEVGDFVRNCRQLIDLLRQVVESGHPDAPAARAALRGLDRGVVAAMGVL